MTTVNTKYNAIITALANQISGCVSQVAYGESFAIKTLPAALIIPDFDDMRCLLGGDQWDTVSNIGIKVIACDTDIDDHFKNVMATMNSIVDAIIADDTLSGNVSGIVRIQKKPEDSIIAHGNTSKMYYGAMIIITIKYIFDP